MSLIISQINNDVGEEIRTGRFDKLIKLLTDGEASDLNLNNQRALATYLERNMQRGIKSGRGRPTEDSLLLAEHLHYEFHQLRREGTNYEAALEIVADKNGISPKSAERHLTAYNKYEKEMQELAWQVQSEMYPKR